MFTSDSIINNDAYLELKDGRGGCASDSDALLLIRDSIGSITVVSDYDNEATLLMGGDVSWNLQVDDAGVSYYR